MPPEPRYKAKLSTRITAATASSFFIVRNDQEFGYNKAKQDRLADVIRREGRYSLNFSDAMHCIKPAWEIAFNLENQEKAWDMGGIKPFHRLPQHLAAWRDARAKRDADLAEAARVKKAVDPASALMSEPATLAWSYMINKFGQSCNATSIAETAAHAAGEAPTAEAHSARLGGSELFAKAPEDRCHKAHMCFCIADVKKWGVDDPKAEIGKLNVNSTACTRKCLSPPLAD